MGPYDSSLSNDGLGQYHSLSNFVGTHSTGLPTPIYPTAHALPFPDSNFDIWTPEGQYVPSSEPFQALDCFAPALTLAESFDMAPTTTVDISMASSVVQSEDSASYLNMLDALFSTQSPSPIVPHGHPDSNDLYASLDSHCESQSSPSTISPELHSRSNPLENHQPASVLNTAPQAPRSRHLQPVRPKPLAPRSSTGPTTTSPSTSNTDSTPAADNTDAGADAGIDYGGRKRKRERNTEAARRYRQRRVEQVDELQAALALVTAERDALKTQLAGAQAESAVLRDLIRGGTGIGKGQSED